MKLNKKRLLLETRYCIAIIIGGIIAGLSYNMLILPNNIAPAGVSGIAAIITRFTKLPMGVLIVAINIPLYILSWRKLGLDFGLKSVLGMLSMSFRNTGSTGGTDIIAKLIVTYFPSFSIGNYVMILDIIIIAANGFTGDNSANVVLYSLICMLVVGYVIDFLQDGVKSAKVYYIITTHGDEIAARINSELSRGATKIKAVGAYTNEEKTMLVCLVLRSEVAKLRRLVRTEDPAAFVYVVDAREVNGLGFEAEDRKKLL